MPHDVSVPCPICQMPRSFHPECFAAALAWIAHGQYDSQAEHHLARRLAPTCYLCGTAATAEVEHITPQHHGGADTWANVGGACQPCNRRKSYHSTTLMTEQHQRWAGQQHAYSGAYQRTTSDLVAGELAIRTSGALTLQPDDPLSWLAEAVEEELLSWIDLAAVVTGNEQQQDVMISFPSSSITITRTRFFPFHNGE